MFDRWLVGNRTGNENDFIIWNNRTDETLAQV